MLNGVSCRLAQNLSRKLMRGAVERHSGRTGKNMLENAKTKMCKKRLVRVKMGRNSGKRHFVHTVARCCSRKAKNRAHTVHNGWQASKPPYTVETPNKLKNIVKWPYLRINNQSFLCVLAKRGCARHWIGFRRMSQLQNKGTICLETTIAAQRVLVKVNT